MKEAPAPLNASKSRRVTLTARLSRSLSVTPLPFLLVVCRNLLVAGTFALRCLRSTYSSSLADCRDVASLPLL